VSLYALETIAINLAVKKERVIFEERGMTNHMTQPMRGHSIFTSRISHVLLL
jgi:hypothetical protein